MCGRYALIADAEQMTLFDLLEIDERLLVPRYNIAPTQPIVVIADDGRGRRMIPMRWGLLPRWVKDPNDFPLLINARSEGIAEKASFRNAFRRRRCLVPASGFYEWQASDKGPKQPHLIRPQSGGVMAFAGLWETWIGADGSEIDTAAIITTEANDALAAIHKRMPVILSPEQFGLWLTGEETPAGALEPLLRPAPEELLSTGAVSTLVNSADNDGPELWAAETGERNDAPAPRPRKARKAADGQSELF